MKLKVKFEGGKELDAALSQFTLTKRRAIGRKALDEGGQIFARAMRDKAPFEDGNLRESIDVGGTLAKTIRNPPKKIAEQERYVGPDSRPSAVQQEFGNENHSAQPFALPSFDEKGDEVLKRVSDVAWIEIEKAVKAAARKAAKGK